MSNIPIIFCQLHYRTDMSNTPVIFSQLHYRTYMSNISKTQTYRYNLSHDDSFNRLSI